MPPHGGSTLLECIQNAALNVIRERVIPENDVESELMEVAMKAMATRSEDRYPSVDAFVEAIKAHRQREQSNRLLRRACRSIDQSDGAEPYRDFGIADALLGESIEVWNENQPAIERKQQLQMQLAVIATQRGDLDLAATIYQAIGQSDSAEAKKLQERRRKRAVSDRKGSRYSALFTKSPDPGLLLHVSSAKIIEANEAFGELFGYQRHEVVGKNVSEVNLWKCPDRREALMQHMQQHGEVDEFEATLLHRDGRTIDTHISSRMVTIEGERMFVSTLRDISIRKMAEHDLKSSRQRLHDMQRLAGLATWSYDVATQRVSWSKETFDLTGRDQEAGHPSPQEYYELVHPDDRQRLQESVQIAIESKAPYEISIRQKNADGKYHEVTVRGQPLFDEAGKPIEVFGVVLPQ